MTDDDNEASESPKGLRDMAKAPLQMLSAPVVGYFDHRFQDLFDRLDDRMHMVYDRVATEVETISELTLGMQRFVDVSGQELRDAVDDLRQLVTAFEGLVERVERLERVEPPADADG